MIRFAWIIMAMVLLLAVSITGYELPDNETGRRISERLPATERDFSSEETLVSQQSYTLKSALENMPLEEKHNAMLKLDLVGNPGAGARSTAVQFSELWNQGHFDEAVIVAGDLESSLGSDAINIVCQWREPLMSDASDRFGNDVRIGTRDSVLINELDINLNTENLWAVLLVQGDGLMTRVAYYRSSNGGDTWGEYGYYGNATQNWNAMAAAIADSKLYCVYNLYDYVYVFKVQLPNGYLVEFDGGGYTRLAINVGEPGDVAELSLETNADWRPVSGHRLYLTCISTDDNLFASWDDENADSWTPYSIPVTNAERGLSNCLNLGYGDYYMFVSYYDNSDNICVDGVGSAAWDRLYTGPGSGSSFDVSSISAYHDTVLCAYVYYGDTYYIRYRVSYTGGSSWLWNYFDDTTVTQEAPAVAGRNGGGFAAIYRYYTSPRQGRFTRRDYSASPWSTPVNYTDNAPYYNQPSIEYLLDGSYGIVYLSWNTPYVRAAYFDRGGCCHARADINHDGAGPDIADLVFLVNYMFNGGPEPPCMEECDVNGDLTGPDIADLVYLVNYMFNGGPPPAPCP